MVLTRGRARTLLMVLAFIAAMVFLVQILSQEMSTLILSFFEALKFVIAMGMGFLLQLLISSDEFRQEFQRFAISAYRRISDIGYSVHQLRQDIALQRSRYPQERTHEFDSVAARVEEIERHVASSEDDWKDFLKREIKALEEIERRRDQIRHIIASTPQGEKEATEQAIQDLRGEIRHLADELPFSLKTLIDIERGDSLPREGRHSEAVASYLKNSIRENSYLRIPVQARRALDEEGLVRIGTNAPYSYMVEGAAGVEYFVMFGNDGSEIGLVENPFPHVYDKDYYITLLEFLPVPSDKVQEMMGGPYPIAIPGSDFDKVAEEWENHFYIKVPVKLKDIAA